MIGKCEQCGMTDVEVKTISVGKNGERKTYAISADQQVGRMLIDCRSANIN